MTKQQLIDKLEQATFYGTWEEACEAQRQLDNFLNTTGAKHDQQSAKETH